MSVIFASRPLRSRVPQGVVAGTSSKRDLSTAVLHDNPTASSLTSSFSSPQTLLSRAPHQLERSHQGRRSPSAHGIWLILHPTRAADIPQGPSISISPLGAPHPPTIFLFGGKVAQNRRLIADMWAMDLTTRTWEKVDAGAGPGPRYFHSMDSCGSNVLL